MSTVRLSDTLSEVRSKEVLLLDVGGLLVRPDTARLLAALDSAPAVTEDSLDRALYCHGRVGAGLGPGDDDDDFVFRFAVAAGATPEQVRAVFTELRDIVLFSSWVPRNLTGDIAALRRIVVHLPRIALVTNSEGGAEEMVRRLGIAQVGPGPGMEVTAVIDSATLGVHKPDPEIFRLAAELLGTVPERCVCLGDSVRNDVEAARGAGVLSVHFDPYGDCAETADHLHATSLAEFAGWFE
ncbi:HAD family hydrolase [Micromonospora craniellae]|uniref:HAD family hydrolase n=1 Tax=Micromonospora craniellae TaxID=2294034 RepID=A0A372FSG0_9ACTN|nr:HAD family hydrolase [Micromonospora craniellae]QOC93469.1 HAD family hydrolase [Micromonospora craniellae]RFS43460.1 HAD family hydrolase [Micromonospora craniellae]